MPRPTVSDLLRLRIGHLLFTSGRSRTEFADYLKITRGMVTMMLSGERGIGMDRLDRIAQFFGVSVPELFMVDGEKFRERRRGDDRRHGERRSGKERRLGGDRRKE